MASGAENEAAEAETAPALAAYFAALTPAVEREIVDDDRLRVTSYLTGVPPPADHVRSVRCVVVRDDSVLALRDGDRAHIVPGGRRESGETLLETLQRELLEETGWTIGPPEMIGVVRLRWLDARPLFLPADSPFYPDFLWLIYTAAPRDHRPEAMLPGMEEGEPVFLPVADAATHDLLDRSRWAPENHLFLAAALRDRSRPSLEAT
jgi:8-oxo-dGTP pyrophosphatase MutT (NUDIX family)